MTRKTVLLLCLLGAAVIGILIFYRNQQKSSLFTPVANREDSIRQIPSETFTDYSDPSGFSFSYPDNLSLEKNDTEDNSTYADLKLSAKDVNGSLSLKIIDSKFNTLDEWLKLNSSSSNPPKDVKLGNLKAIEVMTNDRLLLAALDQGVLFSIEVPLIDEDFWMKVYNKILSGFTFAPPQAGEAVSSSSDGVFFEGEEVVE